MADDVFKIQGTYELVDKVTDKLDEISDSVKKSSDEVDKAKVNYDSFSKKMKDIGKGWKDVGGNLTKWLTVPIMASGVASFKFASDYNESLNKVEVAFGENADAVKNWSKTTLQEFGIASGTALDMTALFGDMGSALGLSADENYKMSTGLTALAGDLASFKNIKIDVAKTALNGIYTGETESLKMLGIVMTEANLEQFALSQGMEKAYKDMTQAEKVQLRYAYVTEMSKNSIGDFSRTSGDASNQMQILTEGLKELAQKIGTVLLPPITKVITKVNEWIGKWAEMDEKSKTIIIVIGGIIAVVGPLVMAIGTVIGIIGSLAAAATTLNIAMLPLTAIIGAIILAVASLVAIGIVLYRNWDEIKATFVGWIDTIKLKWDEFKTKVSTVATETAEKFKTMVDNFINSLVNFFTVYLPSLPGKFAEWISGIVNDAKAKWDEWVNNITMALDNFFNVYLPSLPMKFANWLNQLLKDGITTFENMVNGFVTGFNNFFEWLPTLLPRFLAWLTKMKEDAVKWITETKAKWSQDLDNWVLWLQTLLPRFLSWLNKMKEDAVKWITETKAKWSQDLDNWIEWLKTLLPRFLAWLTQMKTDGQNTIKNIVNGWKQDFDNWIAWCKSIPDKFMQSIYSIRDKARNFFSTIFDGVHLKMPHFSWSGSINPLKWGEEGVPKVGVQWYNKGGIFTQPTVLGNNIGVGDAQQGKGKQAEAVLPIDDLRGMIKDLLRVEIPLTIDGREFVRTVVAPHNEEITAYNKQFVY